MTLFTIDLTFYFQTEQGKKEAVRIRKALEDKELQKQGKKTSSCEDLRRVSFKAEGELHLNVYNRYVFTKTEKTRSIDTVPCSKIFNLLLSKLKITNFERVFPPSTIFNGT